MKKKESFRERIDRLGKKIEQKNEWDKFNDLFTKRHHAIKRKLDWIEIDIQRVSEKYESIASNYDLIRRFEKSLLNIARELKPVRIPESERNERLLNAISKFEGEINTFLKPEHPVREEFMKIFRPAEIIDQACSRSDQ